MAGRSKKQYSHRGITQKSPFFDLPGEIRTLIYRAALFRQTPLDLYPHQFIKCPESVEELDERMSKPKNLGPRPRDFRKVITVRDQYDLAYIRKEMATGLLGTCKQVRTESAMIFWSENTFRFSGDFEWEGVRRFLNTIGPDARYRLRQLQLSPIWALEAGNHTMPGHHYHRIAKNHPKMHMAKMRRVDRHTCTKHRNLESVLTMIKLEGFLKELDFIVPAGWNCSQIPDRFVKANPWEQGNDGMNWLTDLRHARALQVMLLLESGASLLGVQSVLTLYYWGVGVVAQPGSIMTRQTKIRPWEAPISEEVGELSIWPAERETDHITGMDMLFNDSEKSELPACGGRVTKFQGKRKVERVLKGFGGCRFIRRVGYYCDAPDCDHRILDPVKNFDRHRYYCLRCKTWTPYEWKDDLAVQKITRAQRRNWK
jgi:hypothetical protein